MALFNNESKEEKQLRQMQEMMDRFGLSKINQRDFNSCQKIIRDLMGLGLMKAGMALSFAKSEEQCKVGYLSALVEQNWIIIRQLDEMNQHFAWLVDDSNK